MLQRTASGDVRTAVWVRAAVCAEPGSFASLSPRIYLAVPPPTRRSPVCSTLAYRDSGHACCREKADRRPGALKKLMGSYFRYNAVVSMQWLLFGSNGHKTPPEEGQLEGFQRCTGVPSRQMKCFANTYWFHQSGVFKTNQVHQSVFRCHPSPDAVDRASLV